MGIKPGSFYRSGKKKSQLSGSVSEIFLLRVFLGREHLPLEIKETCEIYGIRSGSGSCSEIFSSPFARFLGREYLTLEITIPPGGSGDQTH